MLSTFTQGKVPFSTERKLAEGIVERDRNLMISLGATAAISVLFPVLFAGHLPKQLKTMMLATGLTASASLSYIAGNATTEKRQKLYKTMGNMQAQMQKTGMAHEFAYHATIQDVAAKYRLMQAMLLLPPQHQAYFAQQFGLGGLLQSSIPAQATVDVPAQPAWATNQPIPSGVVSTVEPLPEEVPDYAIASEDWIYEIVAKAAEVDPEKRRYQHLVVNGASQSGKSTLFSKLLELLVKAIAQNGEQAQIALIDPKYPKTRWPIQPSFVGFGQVQGGVQQAVKELQSRKQACIKAERAGQEHPAFSRYILIVDEWDSVWSEGAGHPEFGDEPKERKAIADDIHNNVLLLLKESAAYNMMVVVIGQSPLSGASGFSRSDLNSACRIVLGIEALKWVQDKDFPFKAQKEYLEAELTDLLGQETRCALICPNTTSPFVRSIPRLQIQPLKEAIAPPSELPQDDPLEDLLAELKQWAAGLGHSPTDEELEDQFFELTERELTPEGIKLLKEKLGL